MDIPKSEKKTLPHMPHSTLPEPLTQCHETERGYNCEQCPRAETMLLHWALAKVGKGGYILELFFHHFFCLSLAEYKIFIRALFKAKIMPKFAS